MVAVALTGNFSICKWAWPTRTFLGTFGTASWSQGRPPQRSACAGRGSMAHSYRQVAGKR
jgi:hypothetical protein